MSTRPHAGDATNEPVRIGMAVVPTTWGSFTCVAYRGGADGIEHLAFVYGPLERLTDGEPVLVRVHSECLTGDVFGSRRCDCGPQLSAAMANIAAHECGVVVYLRGHEGRGIGIADKIRAYSLQDQGLDTVDANLELGLAVDERDYDIGARILFDLGIRELRLMTNNPAKADGLGAHGLRVIERVALPSNTTVENIGYLRTKRDRLGHLLDLDESPTTS